jgi:SAM-dependent methyltransferase
MGRWSVLVAREFLEWLSIPAGSRWIDVGCGTGTLSRSILDAASPASILAIDSSPEFIAYARQTTPDPAVRFQVGLAQSLDVATSSVDAVVSGLVLNFVPEHEVAVAEMKRVTRPGGKVGIYLWDYGQGMEMLRYFWDAAVSLDGSAAALDEGNRFPLCRPGKLEALVRHAGLTAVQATAVDVITQFRDFDDYWIPFLGEVGPAPSYNMSLDAPARRRLEQRLRQTLPTGDGGSITLGARAWAVQGIVSGS